MICRMRRTITFSDFDSVDSDVDFDFNSDEGSVAEQEWNTWDEACVLEFQHASVVFLPDSAAVRPAVKIRDKICDMGDGGHPAWDVCCTGRAFDTHGYVGCFDGNIYMARLCLLTRPGMERMMQRSATAAYGSAARRGSPDAACSTLPCAAESPDVVSASPQLSSRTFRRRRPVRVMDPPVLTAHDQLVAAGELVFDCRPPLLPVSMDISGVDVSVIRASAVSAEDAAFPPEREQSFGGGGDLLGLIFLELGVAPLEDQGTDLEDELPTPAASPVTVDRGAAPWPAQVEVDVDLDRVFQDVATLPELVTPV